MATRRKKTAVRAEPLRADTRHQNAPPRRDGVQWLAQPGWQLQLTSSMRQPCLQLSALAVTEEVPEASRETFALPVLFAVALPFLSSQVSFQLTRHESFRSHTFSIEYWML